MAPAFEAQRTDQGDLNDAHNHPDPSTSWQNKKNKLAATSRTGSISDTTTVPVGRPQTPHRRRSAGLTTRDVSRPEVFDRDSIWGTHYHEDPRPVGAAITPDDTSTPTAVSSSQAEESGEVQSTPAMASVDFPMNDASSTTASLFHDRPFHPNGSPLQYARRSLYNLHDLTPLNWNTLALQFQDSQRPDTPLAQEERPSTPITGVQSHDYANDMEQSAERQKYRSWRRGQAKVNGLSIAESQRTKTLPDKVIDAQLPQPEPTVANVRSRKASHYLGLFRENEAEEKRDTEQKKSGKAKGKTEQSESVTQVSKDVVAPASEPQPREPTIAEDKEAEEGEEEDGNHVTVSKEHMSKVYPLDLLEEIRNNHHLEPGASSRKVPSTKHVPAKDAEGRAEGETEEDSTKDGGSEDEESDREHISSAVYFPHQGVTVGDSPTEDQLTDRKQHDKVDPQPPEDELSADDVQVALHSEDARDFLHGISRASTATDFELLPEPAIPAEYRSDSEYESEYDSTTSGDGEDDVETTPTATPLVKGQSQARSPERRHARQSPVPVGAVELKPYQHQVGGHTAMFSFSRRAVCKQLNSKENMFYETVEKHHPDLLTFMPRYIGVLNVTYRKEQKRRKTEGSKSRELDLKQATSPSKEDTLPVPDTAARVISHSMQASSSSTIPEVIFANNRHLIPDNLFRDHRRPATPDIYRTHSSPPRRTQSDIEEEVRRPSLNTASSWGYTTRNQKLRDHILREVFSPPVIHKHDRRDRAYHGGRKVVKCRQAELSQPHRHGSIDISSMRREDIMSGHVSGNDGSALQVPRRNSQRRTENGLVERSTSNIDQLVRESRAALSKSAETSEEPILGSRGHRRRHSGGGLTRKPTEMDGTRGDLEFHEDEAYTGDVDADADESVFSMDDVKKECRKVSKPEDKIPAVANGEESKKTEPADEAPPRLGPAIDFGHPEPRNPETSLIQHDERVEHFLLLEDLTASMQRPCVLDLKMGTRQYGIEASAKKQASQRMKCKTTTSRELGVRVCGMQVYNVKTHSYSFKDKYNGRDLTAGSNFREALKGFFFDGIGYAQAIKHIPTILEKINALDGIIRQLPGYRLYASSLLMIYDRGDADENGKVRPAPPTEDGKPAQYPDIKLKIVDFANCVTAEDKAIVETRPCPPQNLESIDRGYIRGLRTLRLYFQQIFQELCSQRHVERGEGEGMAVETRGISAAIAQKGWRDGFEDDPGEVSV